MKYYHKIICFIKKAAILLVIFLAYADFSDAQLIIRQGSNIPKYYLKVGYGLSSHVPTYEMSSGLELRNNKRTGPLYFKFDYNSEYDLTFGLIIGFEKIQANYVAPYYCNCTIDPLYKYQGLDILFKMNYILMPDKKLQPYFGFSSGLRTLKEEVITNYYYQDLTVVNQTSTYTGDIDFGLNLLIKNGWGAYMEMNLINTGVNIGLFENGRSVSFLQFGIVKTFNDNPTK